MTSGLRSPPALLLGAIILWLSIDFLLVGKSIYISMGDNGDVILSGLLANASLGYGRTYWNVFSTAGVDRLGQGFYGLIDEILFQWLPGWIAYQIRIISQIVGAVLATYHLCRKRLGFGQLPSVAAAFVYADCTTNGQLVQSVMAYLPLSIAVLGCAFDHPRGLRRWLWVGAVCVLVGLTAYLSRLQPFVLFVHVLWFAVIERRRRVPECAAIGLFSLALIAMRATDYIAAVNIGRLSHRVALQFFSEIGISSILSRIILYDGSIFPFAATMLFAFGIAIASFFRAARPPFIAYGIGLGSAAVGVLMQPSAAKLLPLLGSFDVARLMNYLWIFVACGVGAVTHVALESRMGRDVSTRKLRGLFAPAGLIAFLAFISLESKYRTAKDWITQGSYVLAFESEDLRQLAAAANGEPIPKRIEPFQLYPNLLHPYGIETLGGYQALHSKRFYDFWQQLIRNSPDTFRSDRLMLTPQSHRPEWDFAQEYDEDLLSLANVAYVVSRDRLNSEHLHPVVEPANPWSSLTTLEKIRRNAADNFFGRRHLFIYQNSRVGPRFFFVREVRTYATTEALLTALGNESYASLRNAIMIEEKDAPKELDAARVYGSGELVVTRYSPDEIGLIATTVDEALLVAANSYSPYWRAYVNGAPAAIMPAYHAFWAVRLPTGRSEVVFRYEPPWLGLPQKAAFRTSRIDAPSCVADEERFKCLDSRGPE